MQNNLRCAFTLNVDLKLALPMSASATSPEKNPTGPYHEFFVDNNGFVVPGLFGTGPVDHTTEVPFLAVLALNEFKLNP